MKSKSDTNSEILSGASVSNNNVSQVRVRHVDSVHPVDCSCTLCKSLRFVPNDSILENSKKDELDWYK